MFATVTLKFPVAELPDFRARAAETPSPGGGAHLASLTVEQQKICPVTGAKLGSMGDPVPVEIEGRRIWTCCAACPPKLKAEPAKYLARLAPPPKDEVLSVPESAVIDTGGRMVVYVESEPGIFDGREVVLGPRIGDRFPVIGGLSPGEKVAAAGTFLIDAESRLNGGAAPSGPAGPTPPKAGEPPKAAEPAKAVEPPTRSAALSPKSTHLHYR
jgi:Cu(I)/Ag(I) efflux system membrane fusion protein